MSPNPKNPEVSTTPPEVCPENGWESFELPFQIGSGRHFFPNLDGQQSLRMAFYKRTKDAALVGKVWFGHGLEGPPGHVHGGVSAYILDEAMGSACWLKRYACVAANIDVQFLKMTPLHKDLQIEATVEEVNGRDVRVQGRIFNEDGEAYSQGIGYFSRLSRKRIEEFLKQGQNSQFDINTLDFSGLPQKK